MEYVRTCYPTFSVTNARLRAEELSRYVFAAFYQDPDVLVVPGRYKLVAVARQAMRSKNSRPRRSPITEYGV